MENQGFARYLGDNMIKVPEKLEDFFPSKSIGIHHINYGWYSSTDEQLISRLSSILQHGIVSPPLEKKLMEKGIDLGLKRESTRTTRKDFEPEIYSNAFYGGERESKEYLRFYLHSISFRTDGPAVVHTKNIPYNRINYVGANKQKRRIQPRFIRAVVLPKRESKELQKFIDAIKKFRKPIYDYTGKLIWKSE